MNKQLNALKVATKTRRDQSLERVMKTLKHMEKNDLSINFQSVAKMAEVSTPYLYKHPELRQKIKQLRDKSEIIHRSTDLRNTLVKKEKHISKLKDKLLKCDETIAKLKEQLEVAYGEIYKLENR